MAAAPRNSTIEEPARVPPQAQRVRDGSVFFPHISMSEVKRLELYRGGAAARHKPPRQSIVAYRVHEKTDEGDVVMECGGGQYMVRARKHDGTWFDDIYTFSAEGDGKVPSQASGPPRQTADETPNGIVTIPGLNARTNAFMVYMQQTQAMILRGAEKHEERIVAMFNSQAACMATMANAVAGAQNSEIVGSMKALAAKTQTDVDKAREDLLKTKEENLELKNKQKNKLGDLAINGFEKLVQNAPEVAKQLRAGWNEIKKEVDAEVQSAIAAEEKERAEAAAKREREAAAAAEKALEDERQRIASAEHTEAHTPPAPS